MRRSPCVCAGQPEKVALPQTVRPNRVRAPLTTTSRNSRPPPPRPPEGGQPLSTLINWEGWEAPWMDEDDKDDSHEASLPACPPDKTDILIPSHMSNLGPGQPRAPPPPSPSPGSHGTWPWREGHREPANAHIDYTSLGSPPFLMPPDAFGYALPETKQAPAGVHRHTSTPPGRPGIQVPRERRAQTATLTSSTPP